MSYMKVLQALETGDIVTFNDSGGASASPTPQLEAQGHSSVGIAEFKESEEMRWRVVAKGDGEYHLESRGSDVFRDTWKPYAIVETIEIIAETQEVSADV